MPKTVERLPKWSVSAGVITTLLAVFVTQPIAYVLVSMYPALAGWDSVRAGNWLTHSPVANFVMILLFELMAVGVVAAFVRWRHVSFWAATALGRIRWRSVGYAVAGFLIYLCIATVVLAIIPQLFPIDTNQEQAIGFERGTSGSALLLAFIGLVILPPFAEEILFRGFLFGTLRANKVRLGWAIFWTSLFFGSLHLLTGAGGLLWIGLADTFILSLVLCYVREETASLWPCIMIHALKNGLVFLNLFVINVR